jgi:hypothetical protein
MDAEWVSDAWRRDGFVIVPGLVAGDELAGAVAGLPSVFPTADEFHDDADPGRNARFRHEFGGITNFPFTSVDLSLVAVHPRMVELAARLLGAEDVRVSSIEAWAKYTGAAEYEQHHHRDYLNHSVLVSSPDAPAEQVEMFLYLVDVPAELGPPRYVPRSVTGGLPALPNWYPATDGVTDPEAPPGWVSPQGRPELYEAEVSGAGPAGTVVAYRLDTFHRGTALTRARGARYTIHVNFRLAAADWVGRHSWPAQSTEPGWSDFVVAASPRQLQLFGFPPPGHPWWTDDTLAAMGLRYPGFDPEPWRG